MEGTYTLFKGEDHQYYWNLKSPYNNEIILRSEGYVLKSSAEAGIDSCRVNSPLEVRYYRGISKDSQHYFVLNSKNGEPIGVSETYKTNTGRDAGIESCKRYGPKATLVDLTKS